MDFLKDMGMENDIPDYEEIEQKFETLENKLDETIDEIMEFDNPEDAKKALMFLITMIKAAFKHYGETDERYKSLSPRIEKFEAELIMKLGIRGV